MGTKRMEETVAHRQIVIQEVSESEREIGTDLNEEVEGGGKERDRE